MPPPGRTGHFLLPRSAAAFLFLILLPALWGQEKAGDVGIYNFVRLNENYCTGGQPQLQELATLKQEGIKAIINLRQSTEHDGAGEVSEAKRLGLRYYNIPVNSRWLNDEQVREFLKILEDPENRPVFIHCASANRVGAFWMSRRVLVDGWRLEKAEEEANRVGLRSPHLRSFAHSYIERHRKQ